jgi:hypothetical protein
MSIENNLESIASSLDDIFNGLTSTNDFGQTVGDELHTIAWQLERLVEVLEKIETKMK